MAKGVYVRKPISEETRQKLKMSHLGISPWNTGLKGIKWDPERYIKSLATKRERGTDKHPGSGRKAHLTRILRGNDKQPGTGYKSVATKRINGTLSSKIKDPMKRAEYCLNVSKRMKGRKLSEETKKKLSDCQKGKKIPQERKAKIREGILKYIEKTTGKPFCSFGRNETQLLNEQEQKDNCKILRQYKIEKLGYVIDGYCPETNTVYEIYESYHNKQKEHDLKRQEEIQKHLNCDFKIIWDNLWKQ
jgi:hypothetical protein